MNTDSATTGLFLVLTATALLGSSGIPALFLPGKSATGQVLAAILMCVGGIMGMTGTLMAFLDSATARLDAQWFLPLGSFSVALDPLSAFFLCLVFTVPALGAIYGLSYWKQKEHEDNGKRLCAAYGALASGMAMVVIARDGILFLIAWEIMALAAFFASAADDCDPEVRKAGWTYLIATHAGTLILIAMFALLASAAGSFSLTHCSFVSAGTAGAVFLLALAGFGLKAGLMPFHFWLPGAHANAPSHVSAVMSGVMIKMGIYGILRMTSMLGTRGEWWGITMLVAGMVTALAGISFALAQRDMKRMLAYSSVENIGVIAMGMGLAFLGQYHGRMEWVMLGLGGALFHVWNHGMFKSLLFFGAGAVMHATGTRDIEQLGGLGRKMPAVMVLFMTGTIAIAALPPLNGFAGEWLVYLGFFDALAENAPKGVSLAACSAAALAMTGALALACFSKLAGTVFLGNARAGLDIDAHDPPVPMLAPMAVLAAACVLVGILAPFVLPVLDKAVLSWSGQRDSVASISFLAPMHMISLAGLAAAGIAAVLALLLRLLPRRGKISRQVTWDCGYALPTSRMQYTGTSLSQSLVGISGFASLPGGKMPVLEEPFPEREKFSTMTPDLVLDRVIVPFFKRLGKTIPRVRVFQHGKTQLYLLSMLAITIILLLAAGSGSAP